MQVKIKTGDKMRPNEKLRRNDPKMYRAINEDVSGIEVVEFREEEHLDYRMVVLYEGDEIEVLRRQDGYHIFPPVDAKVQNTDNKRDVVQLIIAHGG